MVGIVLPVERQRRLSWLTSVLVLIVALTGATLLYRHFQASDRQLWHSSTHDRNAHYVFALTLANDLRHGQLLTWLKDVIRSQVWGPLHGTLAGVILALGGFDYHLAVLPSLAGWVLLVVFGFLATRRTAPRFGNLAGLTTVVFLLAGPMHRGYAADIMLESLGAGLTMAALYAYLVVAQERSATAGRWLALTLTALYFEKYQYWVIVAAALTLAEVLTLPGGPWRAGREAWRRIAWRRLFATEVRRPTNYLILILVAFSAAVYAHGDRPFAVGGRRLSLYPPNISIQIAYLLLLARLVRWWWVRGYVLADRLPVCWRPLLRWHVWPALIWMALAKHAGYFVWYMSFANTGPSSSHHLLAGIEFYAPVLVKMYHVAPWSAALAGLLAVMALRGVRRLRPGALAVLACALLGAFLAMNHPNHQPRLLITWVPAFWAASGMGLAVLLLLLERVSRGVVCTGLGAAVVAGLGWAHLPAIQFERLAPEGGPRPGLPSIVELTDYYTPNLRETRKAVVMTEVPFRVAACWTALQLRSDRDWFDCIECFPGGFGPPWARERQGVLSWLNGCGCDTIVSIEEGPDTNYWEWGVRGRLYEPLGVLLREQGDYRAVKHQQFPRHGCTVTVWKRQER